MNCPNCGMANSNDSKFCIKCGQSLVNNTNFVETSNAINGMNSNEVNSGFENSNNNELNSAMQNNNNVSETQTNSVLNNYSQNVSNNNIKKDSSLKVSFVEYFFIIIAIILKPFSSLKEELAKFNAFKSSAILSLIVSGIATIISLLSEMFSAIRVKNFDWSAGKYTTSWVWENLKDIEYFKVIGKSFLIYLGVILAIAVVYYLGGLIVKKQTNFSRLLGISALAVTPLLICYLILSPLLSLIWAELSMPIILVSAIYTIVIVYEGMNSEILLDGNAKYYFNLVCLSILGIAAYYLCMKLFVSSISSGLNDLGNMMNIFG